jgi:hypothetical protein
MQYIVSNYINQRVLDRASDLLPGEWVEKSDDKQVELEYLLLLTGEQEVIAGDIDDIECQEGGII